MFAGLLEIITSFFKMPFHALTDTKKLVLDIGGRGEIALEEGSNPHLLWINAAGRVIISVAFIVLLVIAALSAIYSLFTVGLVEFLVAAIGGFLVAIFVSWFSFLGLELMMLQVNMAGDIRRLAEGQAVGEKEAPEEKTPQTTMT